MNSVGRISSGTQDAKDKLYWMPVLYLTQLADQRRAQRQRGRCVHIGSGEATTSFIKNFTIGNSEPAGELRVGF